MPEAQLATGSIRTGVVALIAIAASALVLPNAFTLDDIPIIRDNPLNHSLGRVAEILTSPYWPPPFTGDLYRPFATLMFSGEFVAGGGNALMFRVVTVLAYGGTCLALLRLGSRLMAAAPAFLLTLLFAAHPIHAETLALAVAQNEILVTLIFVLAVTLYLDRRRAKTGLGVRHWAQLTSLYVLASGLKEQGLVLPGLLLGAELTLVPAGAWRERFRSIGPGFLVFLVVGVALLLVRAMVLENAPLDVMPAQALAGQGLAGRIITMLGVVPEWFRLLLWPVQLRVDYSPAEFSASTALGLGEAFGLVLVVATVLFGSLVRRRAPVVAFGLIWCVITLLPVSNVIFPTGILIAERTLFSPSLGFLIVAVGAASLTLQRWRPPRPIVRVLVAVSAFVVTIALVRTAFRERAFRDVTTLAFARVQDSPRSAIAQQAHGDALFELGRPVDAIAAYQRAINVSPSPSEVRLAFASRLRAVGRHHEAVQQLYTSVSDRSTPEGLAHLVAALLAVGSYAEAKRLADRVMLSVGPQAVMVWLRNLADSAIAVAARPGTINVGIRTGIGGR